MRGHVACMKEVRNCKKMAAFSAVVPFQLFWLENMKGRDHLEDVGIDVRIILKWIMKQYGVRLWTCFIWLRMWPIRGGEFLD
jgi:hypothetical protein